MADQPVAFDGTTRYDRNTSACSAKAKIGISSGEVAVDHSDSFVDVADLPPIIDSDNGSELLRWAKLGGHITVGYGDSKLLPHVAASLHKMVKTMAENATM